MQSRADYDDSLRLLSQAANAAVDDSNGVIRLVISLFFSLCLPLFPSLALSLSLSLSRSLSI